MKMGHSEEQVESVAKGFGKMVFSYAGSRKVRKPPEFCYFG